MIQRWKQYFEQIRANVGVRSAALLLYYVAILIGLLLIYGRGDFSTPHFIYQGF